MFAALALASTIYVHSGDTYSSLASEYGTSVSALEAANGYSPTDIPVGASLHLGSSGSSESYSSSYTPSHSSYSEPTSYGSVYHHSSSYSSDSGSSAPSSGHTSASGFEGCVIQHESTGNSQVMNGSGHYGLYQFDESTWVSGGGSASDFGHASASEQNSVFQHVYAARGSQPWAGDGC